MPWVTKSVEIFQAGSGVWFGVRICGCSSLDVRTFCEALVGTSKGSLLKRSTNIAMTTNDRWKLWADAARQEVCTEGNKQSLQRSDCWLLLRIIDKRGFLESIVRVLPAQLFVSEDYLQEWEHQTAHKCLISTLLWRKDAWKELGPSISNVLRKLGRKRNATSARSSQTQNTKYAATRRTLLIIRSFLFARCGAWPCDTHVCNRTVLKFMRRRTRCAAAVVVV